MIDPELDAALKALKQRDGVSEGEQIRRALKDWFKKKGVYVGKVERKGSGSGKRS